MQNRSLMVQESQIISPAEVVENASTQAKLLMDIVEKTGCFQLIAKKKYLQVEAWETIGAFNRTYAVTDTITPIMREGEQVGYQATISLMKDGNVVGRAIMPCFFSENCCKGKEGDSKHKACMSAAQSFGVSKAYRMNFSYVAILAGYEPTPAEEMTGEDTLGSVKPDNEHWCSVHKTKFFKKGNMKGYAHPIEGTKDWCNEQEAQKPVEPAPDLVTEAVNMGATVQPTQQPMPGPKASKEQIAQIMEYAKNLNIVSVAEKCRITLKNPKDLTAEQATAIITECKVRLNQ